MLSELTEAGIVATVSDGRLRLSAPVGRLTPELHQRLAEHRDELLAQLAGGDVRAESVPDLRARLLARCRR
ncbi:hypothetical protein [Lysobacter sp. GCM10012299]|uniref:TubC N-terminal docking domain-related protein n=1 Tax=Lysobacter sp. GCM10012299 TaxID=3317333 RepID=UPI00361CE4E0